MNNLGVLWIASFPKSGNTWINRLLTRAGEPHGFPQGELGVYALLNRGEQPVRCPAAIHAPEADAPAVLKTHAPFSPGGLPHEFPGLSLKTFAFIHIYRNPLDLLLSYVNYTRIEYRQYLERGQRVDEYRTKLFRRLLGFDKAFSYEDWLKMPLDAIPTPHLDHALRVFSDDDLTIETLAPMSGGWADHTRSWIEAAQSIPGTTLRYEDCIEERARLQAVAEHFLFSGQDVVEAAERLDQAMRRKRESGPAEERIFYNKMAAYYFPQYFSRSAVSDFVARHEVTLLEFGYPALLEHYGRR